MSRHLADVLPVRRWIPNAGKKRKRTSYVYFAIRREREREGRDKIKRGREEFNLVEFFYIYYEGRRTTSFVDMDVDRRRKSGPRLVQFWRRDASPGHCRVRAAMQRGTRRNLSLFEFQIGLFIGFG